MNNEEKPKFIAVKAEYFRAFKDGSKTVEWRKFGPGYNERTLWIGRAITISNGYSGARLHGTITALDFMPARLVSKEALLYYAPSDTLVGIHVKLRHPQRR